MTLERFARYAPAMLLGLVTAGAVVGACVGVAVAEFALSHSKPRRHKETR